jgi:hypothetical protein
MMFLVDRPPVSCHHYARRVKEKAFEAQLDTTRYKKNYKVDIEGPNVWYLGLFRVEPGSVERLRMAQDRATKTVDRARVKILDGILPDRALQTELYVRPSISPALECLHALDCCSAAVSMHILNAMSCW